MEMEIMTENKRFIIDEYYNWVDTVTDKWLEVEDAFDMLNTLAEENKLLKIKKKGLESELEIFKEDLEWESNNFNRCYEELMSCREENEQLKKSVKRQQGSNNECSKLKEAIDRIDSLIHTQEDYLAWSIIYETLTDGKPLNYRLKM